MDFERIFQIHLSCVGMVWGGRFRPLFLFKYRRVSKMISIERLGWISNVFFKSTLSALVRGGWIVIHLEPRQNTLWRLRWPILNVRDRSWTFFFLIFGIMLAALRNWACLWLVLTANFQARLELWLGLWLTSCRWRIKGAKSGKRPRKEIDSYDRRSCWKIEGNFRIMWLRG